MLGSLPSPSRTSDSHCLARKGTAFTLETGPPIQVPGAQAGERDQTAEEPLGVCWRRGGVVQEVEGEEGVSLSSG